MLKLFSSLKKCLRLCNVWMESCLCGDGDYTVIHCTLTITVNQSTCVGLLNFSIPGSHTCPQGSKIYVSVRLLRHCGPYLQHSTVSVCAADSVCVCVRVWENELF